MSAIDAARSYDRMPADKAEARRKPDAWAFFLWTAAVLIPATALAAANWTDDLGLIPWIAIAGLGLGALLVVSRFRGRTAFLLAAGYGLVVLLWRLTDALDPGMPWRDRVIDLASRVAIFVSVVFAGEPSRDSLMFVLAMALTFWAIAVFGTWWLFRRGGLWLAVLLPGLAVFLNVYYYRYGTRLQLYLPVFLLVSLALIVRTELNKRRHGWELRRAQVSTDVSSRVTQAGIAAALVLVLAAWLGPHVPDTQLESPSGITGSRSPFNELLSDALAGLRSPVNLYGETFASTLALGAGRPPGDRLVFQARTLQEVPPATRVYWRARAYDTYRDGAWEVTLGSPTPFRPRQGEVGTSANAGRAQAEFVVSTFVPALKQLYLPAEIAWVNRSADLREVTEDGAIVDILEASSAETLLPGDSYRVQSRLAAPSAADLRQASAAYPAWIAQAYLQRPSDLPRRIDQLARQIAASAETPYDQAVAITSWLRTNMRYDREAAAPPPGRDPVDYFLFDSRLGFCDYYASAAVLMLRSLGVPSRLAAGYAQGEYDADAGEYLVSDADLHSWPEVYFPGYGWVEFEPTVSQPALERSQAASEAGGQAGASLGESGTPAVGAGGGNLPIDRLDQLADIEDIQIPLEAASPTPWPGYALLLLLIVAFLVYVTPARRTAAAWAVASAHRMGRRLPPRIEEWAAQPATEAAAAFRRLAAWPARLGIQLRADATPTERAQALAAIIPDQRGAVVRIASLYSAERYGGIPSAKNEIRRAWRSVRPRLYQAGLARLVAAVFPSRFE